MVKVLYFHSEDLAELINAKVKDGVIEIGDKTFFVDGSKAINLAKRTFWGMSKFTEPLYILKWNCLYPAKLKTEVKEKNPVKVEEKVIKQGNKEIIERTKVIERNLITNLTFERDAKNTPESLYKSVRLKILGGMLKVKKPIRISGLLLGVIIGVCVMFLLKFLGIF